ncbi:hypothetical protein AUTU_11580 [Aureibacter tunicatorum]|nr:hypothetical protein AUTU_11580 [Aureibacter tunicatorum]
MYLSVMAQHKEYQDDFHDSFATEAHGENKHQEHHHLGIFLGGDSNNNNPVGIEYEYKTGLMHHHLGFGFTTEFFKTSEGEHGGGGHEPNGESKTSTEGIIIGEVIYHPLAGLKFLAGPGVILKENENEYVTRIGTGYDFHWHHLTLSPTINMDFHNKQRDLVYGFGFGYVF